MMGSLAKLAKSEQRLADAWKRLKAKPEDIDAAFTPEVDEEVAALLTGKS